MTTDLSESLDLHDLPGVTIVRVRNHQVRHPPQALDFGRELDSLVVRDGRNRLLLDFRRAETLGSTAFSILANLLKKVRTVGGRLAVCGLRPSARLGLNISRLDGLIDVFDDERSALDTF
jgi:stage II sporulation protein AA (anti-sigma F factor antagonist)